MTPLHRLALAATTALALAACASKPPPPAWQGQAHSASQRALGAYLAGQDRVATHEWQLAARALARTGQPEALARLALLRCAAEAASLVPAQSPDGGPPQHCPAYNAWQQDAAAPEAAYAAYLRAQSLAPAQIKLLPPAQQAPATAFSPVQLTAIEDPLARLVAAGVQVRRGHISAELARQAADTAAAQGWPRPLLAWLGVQRQLAQQAGQAEEAARLQRRMNLITSQGKPEPPAAP